MTRSELALTVLVRIGALSLLSGFVMPASAMPETKAAGWTATVRGAALAAPAFPGSHSYSFVALPSMNVRGLRAPLAAETAAGFSLPGSRLEIGVMGGVGSRRETGSGFGVLETARPALDPGFFAEYWAEPGRIRLRAEARFDVTGVAPPTGSIGADYVHRFESGALLAAGPRLHLAGQDYLQTSYGFTPIGVRGEALAGAYRSDTGVRSVGAAASLNVGLSSGLSTTFYANFDRMMGQSADNGASRPTTPTQNQFGFGAQMNYSFSSGR
jgi:outer membrane protein